MKTFFNFAFRPFNGLLAVSAGFALSGLFTTDHEREAASLNQAEHHRASTVKGLVTTRCKANKLQLSP